MRKSVVMLSYVVLAASVLLAEKTHVPKIDPQRMHDTVKFLSGDELEGRGTGQKGGDAAANWIAEQFKSYGLKPAGSDGSYFQDVPMVGVRSLPATTFTFVPANGAPVELKNLDDYVTSNETQTESADVDAPIVFVGYGITSPENKWDDYKGYDLRGKVALLFVSEPESNDPNFFKGKALTYNGRWTYKFEETARRGAVGTLVIHRTDLASYPWEVVRNSWGAERSYLRLEGTPKLRAASWIQLEVARKLVAMGGLNLDDLYKQSQSRDFKPIELPVHLKAHVVSSIRPFSSRNVLAMVEGSDADHRRAEAVLYTAHYDHFGIDPARAKGDQIYHGAVDNATGCGILLELARVWAGTKPGPPRSILFAAVTAEEQGLLGSEYLGKHLEQLPVQPILDLNYDALAPIGIPEEVEVSGAERTTFYPEVEKIAKEFNLAIKPDAHPEAGHYYRSDHFSLGRVGIPAFSISEGLKFKGHDLAWGEAQSKDYVEHHYHKPADAFVDSWDFTGDAKLASFGYALGQAAAIQSTEIKWLPGDEFEKAQKKLTSMDIDGAALFAGHPELQPIYMEPIVYPPLARQVRLTGATKIKVTVAEDGSAGMADAVTGHPLLLQAALDAVRKWQFQPGGRREFELNFEFVLIGVDVSHAQPMFEVLEPFYVKVVGHPNVVHTILYSASNR
ncbi:MAG TPA: TonB family protein [Candidatus Sulfotelmatobacter sp.]|jgi:TonB family protein|nr:TonB family protein [Candidatus Sulfotelmatobacter sp.]